MEMETEVMDCLLPAAIALASSSVLASSAPLISVDSNFSKRLRVHHQRVAQTVPCIQRVRRVICSISRRQSLGF